MSFVLWIIAGLLIAGLLVFMASLQTRRRLPAIELPDGEKLPRTHLQRYAVQTLLIITPLTLLAAAIVVYYGPEVWWESDPVRITFTLILIAALVAYLIFTLRIRALESRSDGSFDERDAAIFSGSYSGVGGSMMVVMAIWVIALTEAYVETHQVPTYFLTLIFWSCVMTNVIASVSGILLAYRQG